MDASPLNGEQVAIEAGHALAIGVKRETAEILVQFLGGRPAYLQIVKVPPEQAENLSEPPGFRRVDFGEGITLLVGFPT